MKRPQGKIRWMKWALIASLAANVAIVAAVVGAIATGGDRRHGGDGARQGGGPPEIAALARGLERDDRQALFQALRGNGPLSDGRARMTAAREATAEVLRAEPFDRAAFEASIQAQRVLRADLATRGITVLSEIVAGLTAQERATLADRMMESRQGRRDRE